MPPIGRSRRLMSDRATGATTPADAPAVVWRRPSLRALLDASHPGPVAAVTAASVGYAIALGRGTRGVVLVGLAVLAGQLSVGWLNDRVDLERDRAVRRTDKPLVTGRIGPQAVGMAAVLAGVATIPLSLASGLLAGLVHLIAVAAAWAYDLWLKRGPLSFLPFLVAFGLLPAFVSLGGTGSPWPPWWAPTAAAMLGVAAHLLNVAPDREADLAAGVRPLGHRLPPRLVLVLAALLLWGSSLVLVFAPGRPGLLALASLALTTGLAAVACLADPERHGRLAFRLVLLIACCDVATLVLAAHYR